eukprot:CAMPEP_0201123886 /NCGR_PEP_ID=MMETSP0850-20130426/9156_1 /ASSEMBLY_ACC=CAM_ASM_000622 /TAXON_ID=183588 /ORGANISM="Pseudo-nitzschia fraudulenta, Strain WWA7" /LENGTH=236 /DNA_ID=CAMNT_0047390995 /DNA_START=134 /DNA_END=844 /DNA_ORIENTATION=+
MKLASGTIASLVLTVGALLFLVALNSSDNVMNSGRRPPKTSYLRSASSRQLDQGNDDGSNYDGNYGNNYANYQDNSGNNEGENYDNQDYDNSNYIWQRDDDDNYKNDDASYYNSNSNYQADGSGYNGRGQEWGGSSVQTYDDDADVEITEVGCEDECDNWHLLGKFGGLNGMETLAVAGLMAVISLSVLCLLLVAGGVNIVEFLQMYCCCGAFRNRANMVSPKEAIEDGFVKLGDY